MAGIYAHIPFCKSRCIYCDFYSTPYTDRIDEYINTVLREAETRREELTEPVTTVYFGGGTPSQLSTPQLTRLITGLRERVNLSQVEEFTVEVNPDDITTEWVEAAVAAGVNRVSMGVQSFNDKELLFMRRRHNAAEAIAAVHTIQRAGVSNMSIDLIYSIPGQTIESWRETIATALMLKVQHISAYELSYERGTELSRQAMLGQFEPIEEDPTIQMYHTLASELAAAGFEHYEVSNFAKPGFRSRHNSAYWQRVPYLGLGAAAHSFNGRRRSYNPDRFDAYITAIETFGKAYKLEPQFTREEKYDEMIFLGLRTIDGLDLRSVSRRFGKPNAERIKRLIQPFIASGDAVLDSSFLSLTEKGLLLSDTIIRELMADDDFE